MVGRAASLGESGRAEVIAPPTKGHPMSSRYDKPSRGVPLLAAVGTLIAAFIAGVILIALGLELIGIIVVGSGLILALVVWLMMATRL
jgi:hypothetical protein